MMFKIEYEGEEEELNDDLREQYDGHDLTSVAQFMCDGTPTPAAAPTARTAVELPSAAAEAAQETAAIAIQRLIRGVLSRTKVCGCQMPASLSIHAAHRAL